MSIVEPTILRTAATMIRKGCEIIKSHQNDGIKQFGARMIRAAAVNAEIQVMYAIMERIDQRHIKPLTSDERAHFESTMWTIPDAASR